jgi:hypothetical protein
MEEMESPRLKVLMKVRNLAIHDDDFRREVMKDPGKALRENGFALNTEELITLAGFHRLVEDLRGERDEELVEVLKKNKGDHRWGR